jgi:hypothetical protein
MVMDFVDTAEEVAAELEQSRSDSPDTAATALLLALFAWRHCIAQESTLDRWALFGADLTTAVTDVFPSGLPRSIANEWRLHDSLQLRKVVARLAIASASHLSEMSRLGLVDLDRRWTLETAAIRLLRAARSLSVLQ